MSDLPPSFVRIRDLVEECLDARRNYVNLETGRKNKDSLVLNKKEIFIDHYFRIFSSHQGIFDTFIRGLSVAFPSIAARRNDVNPIVKILTSCYLPIQPTLRMLPLPSVKSTPQDPIFCDEILDDRSENDIPDIDDGPNIDDIWTIIDHDVDSVTQQLDAVSISTQTSIRSNPEYYDPKSSYHKTSYPKSSDPKKELKGEYGMIISLFNAVNKLFVAPLVVETHSTIPTIEVTPPTVQLPYPLSMGGNWGPKYHPSKISLRSVTPPPKIISPSVKPVRKVQEKKETNGSRKKKESGTIPSDTRSKVWRQWCGNLMDGRCFCCENEITYEKWHCGHITARAKGGGIEPENLRPTCHTCNLSMGTMNMYEYIILNRMPGVRRLSPSDPTVKFYLKAVEAIIRTGKKIDWLENQGHLTKHKQ